MTKPTNTFPSALTMNLKPNMFCKVRVVHKYETPNHTFLHLHTPSLNVMRTNTVKYSITSLLTLWKSAALAPSEHW